MRASGLSQSAGTCRLRGEPRQCGDRAHRLVAPSLAPTGERRPSMACLHPIPAPPRLSPPACPWLRRCRPTRFDGNGSWTGRGSWHAETGNTTVAKDVAARGFRPSGSRLCGARMYRARVLEQDAEPRGGRNHLAAAAPPEELYSSRMAAHARLLSDLAVVDPCPPTQLGEEPQKSPLPGAFLCLAE